MASVASQLIEEVTAHGQSDSLEDAREICLNGTYFPNNLRTYRVYAKLIKNITVYVKVKGKIRLLTYLLTSWSRVLLEKPTGFLVIKKFPAFYRTRNFITAFTSDRHLSLSWASWIQSIRPTSHFSKIHRNIILLSTPGSPQWSLFLRFPYQNPVHASPLPILATCPAHLILLDFITRTILGEDYRTLSSLLCSLLHSHVTSSLLGPNILLSTQFSNTLSPRSSLNVSDQVSHPYKTTGEFCL